MRYTREEIVQKFLSAGFEVPFPDGASQEQLRELFEKRQKTAYLQFCFDRIVGQQSEPLLRKCQDDPEQHWRVQTMLENFHTNPIGILFGQALGIYDSTGAPVHASSTSGPCSQPAPITSQTPPAKPPEPQLTPEQVAEAAAAALERRRAKGREKSQRYYAKHREAIAEAYAKKVAAERDRQKAFGEEFAGNPNPDPEPREPKHVIPTPSQGDPKPWT
jgi:hypothetical protein